MATKTQTLPEAFGFLKSEAPGTRSREAITLKSGENLNAGAVITGTDGTVTTAADSGNTGNGAFASTPAGVAGVMEGDYRLVVVEPATDGGTFVLYRPDGTVVGKGSVGSAFSDELSFTLNDGATDFAAGDAFTITVDAPKWIERAAGIKARGILGQDTDASGGDKAATAVVRDCEVNKGELNHVSGATQAQKDQAVRDLKQAGVIAI